MTDVLRLRQNLAVTETEKKIVQQAMFLRVNLSDRLKGIGTIHTDWPPSATVVFAGCDGRVFLAFDHDLREGGPNALDAKVPYEKVNLLRQQQ